jgi:phage tail-like protein
MQAFFPPVGFFFSVEILGNRTSARANDRMGFQEVSGISAGIETETIVEGGENRFAHKVPKRVKYDSDLTLKRGLITTPSPFGDWCRSYFSLGINLLSGAKKIDSRDLIIHLMDADKKEDPLMSWAFFRTYPVKWEITGMHSQRSEIVVESLTLTYAYFETLI